MSESHKLDNGRRAFLRGQWSDKTGIGSNCLNMQGIFCQSCKDVCDEGAIVFQHAQLGVSLPSIKLEQCTHCQDCLECCPTNAITISTTGPEQQ
jgi:ferredoxin-type protein NapF